MPEKMLSEIPRPLRELYEKGNAAFQRENWDYAIAIFNQVLQNEPAFYDCREALRACQFKKAEKATGFFKRFLGSASNSPLLAKGQIVLRSNAVDALHIAEQILNSDPSSTSAHKLLAEAAMAASLPRTAVLSLEIARKQSPHDKDIALRLGEALIEAGQVAKAEHVYRDLERAYPHDQAILQALKNVTARRTMVEGGYEALSSGEGSYRDILKDKEEAASLELEHREVKSADVAAQLIDQHKASLAKDPGNIKLLRTLAELYIKTNDLDAALEHYNRALQAGPGDSALEATIAEVTAKKFDQALAQLDPGSAGYEDARAKIESDKLASQIAAAREQVERYPSDLQRRFELGQLCFRVGNLKEAIQELQRAQSNPHVRISAMNFLGQCFERRGMNDLAVRTFQNAIKEKAAFDEEKKELIYLLGSVFEKMGKKEEAIEQFKQIYEVDIGYRDVAAKVDTFYGG